MVSRRSEAIATEGVNGELIDQARTELVSRPVQLQLLARRVRRHLSAAPAQRRLQPPDRRRQPARSAPSAAPSRGSKLRPTTTTSTAGRKCAGQRQAAGPGRAQPRRAAVRARRALDLPQPAGHACPAARGVSPQGARLGQHGDGGSIIDAKPSRLQASRPRSAAAVRPHPRKSLVDHFYDNEATLEAVVARRGAGAGRFRRSAVRSQAPPQSEPRAGAAVPARASPDGRRSRSPRASR